MSSRAWQMGDRVSFGRSARRGRTRRDSLVKLLARPARKRVWPDFFPFDAQLPGALVVLLLVAPAASFGPAVVVVVRSAEDLPPPVGGLGSELVSGRSFTSRLWNSA